MLEQLCTETTGLLLATVTAAFTFSAAMAEDVSSQEKLCKDLGARLVAFDARQEYKVWSAEGTTVHFSFSAEIKSCVGTKTDYPNNAWMGQDISHNFMDIGPLFWCNAEGVDNAIIDAVRSFKGQVNEIDYREWLDNGEGGPASAVQVPQASYGRDRCATRFKRKLAELRLVDPPE